MKFRNSTLIAAAALLAAPAAFAQTAQTSPAPPATPQTAPAPAPGTSGAGTAATATVSEGEVTQFATAALAVSKIRQDAAVPDADKNAKSVSAITATGLTAARFNEIAQAMQGDPVLNKRIQDAAAKQAPPAAAAPAQR
ncbi:lipoprotein-anchoring transpeptidase ErfK/SrfK [Sphingomonas naasensis]|uniref:DUF4168 domain-containing protein n=1 Tax=Sphingomonas naasensis TaxID=1344951 RepID=A0A4S1WH70_9SPHN|nr:DUF4168 domain-containing protein [Sphingomonas naasensis]NIJ21851.1 lipoprotein-anchoring transpeptidase ErfK/SrfK [Sphingomonas naasensis]TGX42451.1 DUF4168 domain-containing protein [Sphingomonas naasensis]